MSDEFDDLMEEAIDNIRNDRKIAREFLNELANQIAQNAENNRALSPVAAKHIETMQRSNEQLVRVLTLKQKERVKEIGLSDEDKASLFDMIQGEA
jgi:predicted ATP-grasp superfamily ATP-dependent carboligase